MQFVLQQINRQLLIIFFLLVISSLSFSQEVSQFISSSTHLEIFKITSFDTSITLKHKFIIMGSEIIVLDSIPLINKQDYFLNTRFGILTLKSKNLNYLIKDSTCQHQLVVKYKAFPFSLKEYYQHREPASLLDTSDSKPKRVTEPSSKFSIDDLFKTNFQKSGSIVRGFTIGSNRDLTLNSGFRMQMSGNISDDIEIVAALTDENTPIQPEGTTQTLQEVDKIFIDIRSSVWNATLGDFNLSLAGSEFGNINRKLQGAKGNVNYQTNNLSGEFMISGAAARGKFTNNQFQGIDGVQGPYRLAGRNNERDIIVIAGTERVYIDGEQMKRGEINDYVIDYSTGEITFTPKRLITSASRISIDYEYSDRQFNRNLVAAKSGANFMNNKVALDITLFRESDDESSPIGFSFGKEDLDTLQYAGDDRLKAIRTGVENVGRSKGQYKDTVFYSSITNDTIRYYIYQPEDTINSVYSITFSYVGMGKGDYKKISIGHFEYVSKNQGSYLPVRFLPLPQANTFTDLGVKAQLWDSLNIVGEYAISSFDANKLSDKDDSDNIGRAINLGLQFNPQNIRINGHNIGSIDLNLKERYVNHKFTPLDRINEIEFRRKWNILDSTNYDEEIREGTFFYRTPETFMFGGGIGRIKRGDLFSTNRYTFSSSLYSKDLPKLNYNLEVIKSRDLIRDVNGSWFRQKAGTEYVVGNFTPSLSYEGELYQSKNIALNTMKMGSFRYNEIRPQINIANIYYMSLSTGFAWRWDDSLLTGNLQRASRSFSQRYGWELHDWNSLSSNIDLIIRNSKFTVPFKRRMNSDVETILLRSQTRFTPLNRGLETELFYEVATERSSKLERVFQRVSKGTGNYLYRGDINHNNITDEQDFQPTRFDGDYIILTLPTDELVPIIDLKASSRVRLSPFRFLSSERWFNRILSKISTETYFRIEEKSSERSLHHIYLMHLSKFLNNTTTLSGSNLYSQDIYLFENNPEYSIRFRFIQRKGLIQFALSRERSYNRERSMRLRWQLIKEVANQIDYINKTDIMTPSAPNYRNRSISSNTVISDWSYRPEQYIEIGFKFGVGRSINFDTTYADLNEQSVRCVYSFEERGQVHAEITREEVNLVQSGSEVPYELTNGKALGKSWLWQVACDYRVTKFIQATIQYNARSEGGGQIIHNARAEVRAFF